jgi:hypothetical protein
MSYLKLIICRRRLPRQGHLELDFVAKRYKDGMKNNWMADEGRKVVIGGKRLERKEEEHRAFMTR